MFVSNRIFCALLKRGGVCCTATTSIRKASFMSEVHLSTGSSPPPLTPGKIRAYSMKYCPFAERMRITLAAKDIPHDIVNVNLVAKPEWIYQKHEFGKVPAIELNDGKIVYDSLIVVDYLDDAFPDKNKLNPSDPFERANNRLLLERFSKVPGHLMPLFKGSEGDVCEWWKGMMDNVEFLEKELADRGTTFFGGTSPKMLDYMIWPWFERFEVIPLIHPSLQTLDPVRLPKLTAWFAKMKQDPAVQKVALPPQLHAKFIQKARSGVTDYEVTL